MCHGVYVEVSEHLVVYSFCLMGPVVKRGASLVSKYTYSLSHLVSPVPTFESFSNISS